MWARCRGPILVSIAVLAGVGLGVSIPTVVVHGEGVPTAMGTTTLVTLTSAAGLWLRHGLVICAPGTGWLPKTFAAVLASGLLVASTIFFLAIGAAIATFGALGYGATLARRSRWAVRAQGIALTTTAIAVVAAASVGDLTTDHGFEVTGIVFSIGMGVSTLMLAATPALERPTDQC